MTKVSVAIPTYNGSKFLKDTIASVLCQTFQDFELVVVDDCSTDATEDVVRSFDDPRIKFVKNRDHLGLPGNWNRCIGLCRGEYVTLFHQDDLMLPLNLEKKASLLERSSGVGLVCSNFTLIDSNGDISSQQIDLAEDNLAEDFIQKGDEFFKRLISGRNIVCCPSVLARRKCYERLGGFDLRLPFAADFEMWMRISQFYDVALLSESLIQYRWHEHNETHRYAGRIDELKQDFMAKKIAICRVKRGGERRALQRHIERIIAERALDWACDHRRAPREIRQLLLLTCRFRPSLFLQKKKLFTLKWLLKGK